MRRIVAFAMLSVVAMFLISGCEDDHPFVPLTPPDPPRAPSGSIALCANATGEYSTAVDGGDTGNLEYQFNWGKMNLSDWSTATSIKHSWSNSGVYGVRARVRDASDNGLVSGWSDSLKVTVGGEIVGQPGCPSGRTGLCPDEMATYSTDGATSSCQHTLDHRFDWGDGTFSDWSSSTNAMHSWPTSGTYQVRAQARCATHTNVASAWSDDLNVTVTEESISTPPAPSGPSGLCLGEQKTYCTDDAASTCGHPVEFQFDWADGSFSDWSLSPCASHSWSTVGSYPIKVRARCRTHTGAVSPWSDSTVVSAGFEAVSVPTSIGGARTTCPDESQFYTAVGAMSSCGHPLEYRFDWGDGTYREWSPDPNASHSWSAVGSFVVKAKARCATHLVESPDWRELPITVAETISPPHPPIGLPGGCPGTTLEYSTGAASSSCGHTLEYRFDWGNGPYSPWSTDTMASHSWSAKGTYLVRAQARCPVHSVESAWSSGIPVTVNETIEAPTAPQGETSARRWRTYEYCTYSVQSSCPGRHDIDYQFDWGDGTSSSDWFPNTCAEHQWNSRGTFNVRVRARCHEHQDVVSPWSPPLTVSVSLL